MAHRVGVVGAGQLARMMAQAAIPLGIEITLLAASADDGAAQVVPRVIVGDPDDPDRVRQLAERVDVVTFDHELVDPDMLAALEAAGHAVFPGSETMRLAQNKRLQRERLTAAGFRAPAWAAIDAEADLRQFAQRHGPALVLKATRGGYDGRGVWMTDGVDAALAHWREADARGVDLLVEQRVSLEGELAVLVAGSRDGQYRAWPPTETVQRDGICHELHVPARFHPDIAREAERVALEIARVVGVVGVLAIEFFVADGDVLVNELAPRPHNSGHWTIEGAATSQFAQHLRAVLGWPLGSTVPLHPAVVTRNVLGPSDGSDPIGRIPAVLGMERACVHWYGKTSRPGRKIGHVTAVAATATDAAAAAERAWAVLAAKDTTR